MYVKEGRWLPSLRVLTAASCAAELSSSADSEEELSAVDPLSGSELCPSYIVPPFPPHPLVLCW